jgi:hypothetical protein
VGSLWGRKWVFIYIVEDVQSPLNQCYKCVRNSVFLIIFLNLKFTLTCHFLRDSRETCSNLFSWLPSDSIQKLLLYCHRVNHGHLFTYQIIPRFVYPANEFKSTSTKEQKESLELKMTWPRTWLMKQGGNLQRKCFYNKPHVFWACLIHV